MSYNYKHRTSLESFRFFLLGIFILWQKSAVMALPSTENWISAAQLREKITEHAQTYFAQNYANKKLGVDMFVQAGQIDSRLKLSQCSTDIDMKVNVSEHSVANATIKATCHGDKRWSIYVPIKVDIYEQAIIASSMLVRGNIISKEDLSYKRINVARFNTSYFSTLSDVAGQQVVRTIRAGELVKPKSISAAKIVNKGDKVVLRAKASTIAVEVSAIALENGALGNQIRVKNSQSQRIIDATVTAPGQVTVNF